MRYTTVIDISEFPQTYRNHNARLLYLHMALKAGYHDTDRDILDASIRRLAADVGLTVSATRHALGTLQKDGLASRQGDRWRVLKWVVIDPPTPRKQPKKAAQSPGTGDLGAQYDKEIEEYRIRVYNAIRQSSKAELLEWLQELEDGRRLSHHGASIAPNADNINWLKKVIEKL